MFTPPVGAVGLPSAVNRILNCTASKLVQRIIPRINGPITFLSSFPDQSVLGTFPW